MGFFLWKSVGRNLPQKREERQCERLVVRSVWAAIQLEKSNQVAHFAGGRPSPRKHGFPCVRSTRGSVRQLVIVHFSKLNL